MAIPPLSVGTVLRPDEARQPSGYRIDRVIGDGGFGITYLVTDLAGHRQLVIKEFALADLAARDLATGELIPHARSEELHDRFVGKLIEEAEIMRRVRHPNVVRVHDAWRQNGTAYYVMDYIDGEQLPDSSSPDWSPLPWTSAVNFAEQLLSALEAVHRAGLIHGDVKPSNVLVRHDGRIVLVDFGAARDVSDGQRTVTSLAWTRGYSAPELRVATVGGDVIGPQSDMYGFGLTILGLSFRHPGSGGAPLEPHVRHILPTPEDPYEKILSEIDGPWARALRACIRIDPRSRPQSAVELRRLLNSSEEPHRLGLLRRRGGDGRLVRMARIATMVLVPAALVALLAYWFLTTWQTRGVGDEFTIYAMIRPNDSSECHLVPVWSATNAPWVPSRGVPCELESAAVRPRSESVVGLLEDEIVVISFDDEVDDNWATPPCDAPPMDSGDPRLTDLAFDARGIPSYVCSHRLYRRERTLGAMMDLVGVFDDGHTVALDGEGIVLLSPRGNRESAEPVSAMDRRSPTVELLRDSLTVHDDRVHFVARSVSSDGEVTLLIAYLDRDLRYTIAQRVDGLGTEYLRLIAVPDGSLLAVYRSRIDLHTVDGTRRTVWSYDEDSTAQMVQTGFAFTVR